MIFNAVLASAGSFRTKPMPWHRAKQCTKPSAFARC